MKFEALDKGWGGGGGWRRAESEKEQLKYWDEEAVCLQMKSKRQSERDRRRAPEVVSGHRQQVREFGL